MSLYECFSESFQLFLLGAGLKNLTKCDVFQLCLNHVRGQRKTSTKEIAAEKEKDFLCPTNLTKRVSLKTQCVHMFSEKKNSVCVCKFGGGGRGARLVW